MKLADYKYLELLNEEAALKEISTKLGSEALLSSSFGYEDQVILDMIYKHAPEISVFTIDTGRLFEETYEVYEKSLARYQINIKVYYPKTDDIQKMVQEKGPNLFYESVENRHQCCHVRKIEPLQRALAGKKLWITGLRSEQSEFRKNIQQTEWDEKNKIVKYHPLLHWTEEEVINYITKNNVPYNKLHDKGYPSIGCAPCTRAVLPGENFRAGRWWWENSHKECGLHQ